MTHRGSVPAITLLASVAILAFSTCALAAGSSRLYRNDALRVRAFEPPANWQLAPQSSYPRLCAAYSHENGGRMTLTAQKVPAGSSAESLARSSRLALERQGFTGVLIAPDREGSRVRLEAKLDGGKRLLQQLYSVDGDLGYVVSLVAPEAHAAEMQRDFEAAARSFIVGAVEPRQDSDGGLSR